MAEAMFSEFDYFTHDTLRLGILEECDKEVSPTAAIVQTGPMVFDVKGDDGVYRDLSNTLLQVKVKIVAADGTDQAADVEVAPVNLLLHALFESVDLSIGGNPVNEACAMYPYRAYLEKLLTLSPDTLAVRTLAEGWIKDKSLEWTLLLLQRCHWLRRSFRCN